MTDGAIPDGFYRPKQGMRAPVLMIVPREWENEGGGVLVLMNVAARMGK